MYKIVIDYDTGDSFHTEEGLQQDIEMRWSNLDRAKESLERIKAHYAYYKWKEKDSRWMNTPEVAKPEWYLDNTYFSIPLVDDHGNQIPVGAFWCGYFERLNGAKITTDLSTDSDMHFNI